MRDAQRKAVPRLQFSLQLAATIGLTAGLLIGIWDSFSVLVRYAGYPFDLHDALALTLYSMAVYGAIGFLGTLAVGLVVATVIPSERYYQARTQVVGLVLGIGAAFTVYILLDLQRDPIDLLERALIAAASGLAFGTVCARLLRSRLSRIKLGPLCISLAVWVSLVIYVGLLVNHARLPERPLTPVGIVIDLALAVGSGLAAIGVYRLSVLISQRAGPSTTRLTSSSLAGCVLVACIVVSSTGPYNSEPAPYAITQADNAIGNESATPDSALRSRPNIIWIVMDTVRADFLSCYGYPHSTTPRIDEIAREGVVFENAFSAAPWTLPSHASLFTGLLTCEHGTQGAMNWLSDRFDTIAEVLSNEGYTTLGYTNNPLVCEGENLTQGFDVFEVKDLGKEILERKLSDHLRIRRLLRSVFGERTTTIGGEVYDFVEDDGAQKTNDVVSGWISHAAQQQEPFFLFLNYMEAHAPLHPPESYTVPFLPDGVAVDQAMKARIFWAAYITGQQAHDEDRFELMRALYAGELAYLDFRIGELLDHCREIGILDSTMIIITSDHGQNFGDHGLMSHAFCVYDTLIHVPLIVRYPPLFQGGQRVEAIVQTTDIFPTIVDALGIDYNEGERIRWKSLLDAGGDTLPRFVIAQDRLWPKNLAKLVRANPDFDISVFQRELEAIRTPEFKYIWGSDGSEELYNVQLDPDESYNLVDEEPEIANELRTMLWEAVGACDTKLPAPVQE